MAQLLKVNDNRIVNLEQVTDVEFDEARGTGQTSQLCLTFANNESLMLYADEADRVWAYLLRRCDFADGDE